MAVAQGLKHVSKKVFDLKKRKSHFLIFAFVEQVSETASRQPIIHDVKFILSINHFIYFYDIRVVQLLMLYDFIYDGVISILLLSNLFQL